MMVDFICECSWQKWRMDMVIKADFSRRDTPKMANKRQKQIISLGEYERNNKYTWEQKKK